MTPHSKEEQDEIQEDTTSMEEKLEALNYSEKPNSSKEEMEKRFREKCTESYAKGGFLTTDHYGDWQIDTKLIEIFIHCEISLAVTEALEEVKGRVEKLPAYSYREFAQTKLSVYLKAEDVLKIINQGKI